MARNARGLENTIARYQLSAPWAASRSRVRMASRAAAADDRPVERSDLSQDFPEVSCRSGNQGSWKKNIYLDLRAWLLVNIALTNAAGCGTDRAVSDLSRSGRRAAASHATTAPQSCPTRCTGPRPATSMSSTTSSASSEQRYAHRGRGRAPGEYPLWSGATVRYPRACRSGETASQQWQSCGKPCRRSSRCPVDRPSVTHVENEPVPGKTGDPLCAHQTPFSATTRTVAREVTDPGGKFPAFVL